MKNVDNPTTTRTSIINSGDATIGFQVNNQGVAPALLVSNATGVDNGAGSTSSAGVFAFSPNSVGAAEFAAAAYTGVYGWAPAFPSANGFGTGVWGDSDDVGTYGSGSVGVRGDGFYGMVAAGQVGGGAGLLAWGGTGTGNDVAIDVRGKAKFSRSGRATIAAGQSTKKISLTGVTWSSLVFAVLRSNRSGRYVRAVVPTTGSFTIYLNTTVTSSTYVVWFVVN